MKQTVNVNIGSMPFTLDEDAYRALRDYFDDVHSRLPEGDAETEADIETRMGEILREQAASPMYVVSLDRVRAAIERLGTPDCFGTRHGENLSDTDADARPRKLYRSRTERSIAGVCGGAGRIFRRRSGLVQAGYASAHSLRWPFHLDLCHPVDRRSRRTCTEIYRARQKKKRITKNNSMETNRKRRLYRVRNGVFAGVCGGVAEYFGLRASSVRLVTLLLILFGGLSIWIYVLLWLIVPKEPKIR